LNSPNTGHPTKQASNPTHWQFWIDTGGTFTDCLALDPEGRTHRTKVLSSATIRARFIRQCSESQVIVSLDSAYPSGLFQGFFCRPAIVESETNSLKITDWNADSQTLSFEQSWSFPCSEGELLLLQFDGEAPELAARILTGVKGHECLPTSRLRLATTKGTNALLERKGGKTVMVIDRGLKDLLRIHNQQRPDLFALDIQRPDPLHKAVVEVSFQNGKLENPSQCLAQLERCLKDGIDCAAVVLMHAWKDTEREKQIEHLLQQAGFKYISLSGECVPFIKILDRAETTLANASLSPVLDQYLSRITRSFGEQSLLIMTSAGSLLPPKGYFPKDSLVSGPAGGVVGASGIGERAGFVKVIGFDMGGTSTDVSRYDGALDYQHLSKVGDIRVVAPSLRIETVAAGGGSVCLYDGNRLRVGPESAGASPGPACYGTGGPLTVTDVNLLLGRVDPERFSIPIDVSRSKSALQSLRDQLQRAQQNVGSDEELLTGLLTIANENMAEAIHTVSTAQGYDPSEYALIAFGGAGGQHACAIAKMLGMRTILYPGDAGLLSAYGLQQAAIERIVDRQMLISYESFELKKHDTIATLESEAQERLPSYLRMESSTRRVIVSMRQMGQESALEIDDDIEDPSFDLKASYQRQFRDIYGYEAKADRIEVAALRVIVGVAPPLGSHESFSRQTREASVHSTVKSFVSGQWQAVPVFSREELEYTLHISGPAIIQDAYSTFYVEEGWQAQKGDFETIKIENTDSDNARDAVAVSDAVKLELFTNRFQALVENMGVRLQRTALSPNVKERLDFSCALLDCEGKLVVNAPHIPVHLGALGSCVRSVSAQHEWNPGDVIVTNHPGFGGSHLPDVTVIAPIWDRTKGTLAGFLANRAHHAEMGGIAPGSMPPSAKNLEEEGVIIPPTQVMHKGVLNVQQLRRLLTNSSYPSRRVEENLADLNAQVAAILKGLTDYQKLVDEYGSTNLIHYMCALQNRAEQCMRRRLENMPDGNYSAEQQLDDGSVIKVKATVISDTLHLDFSGSAPVHPGNYNATPGIVASAVLYFLRVWLQEPIPLNEGLLSPVTLHLPHGMLNPPFPEDPTKCPPVVAGNVETSQRLVDTLMLAFELAACSQGTMNNLIFGNQSTSFYETIAGGSGAGNGFDGESGVHVHMTNTAITDPEILEQRFPVRLHEFSLRKGSGGKGKFRGGDGVVRELEFLEPVTLSLLTQHRNQPPYGLQGGAPGACGEQYLIRKSGKKIRLEGNTSQTIEAGDRIRIHTPGGGGWGKG